MTLLPILLAIAILVAIYFWSQRKSRSSNRGISIARPRFGQDSQPQVNARLKQQLVRLLGGNREAAERLVEREKFKNPGRSESWYWEKVLCDLERDRGR